MKRFLVFFVALSFLFCGTVFAFEKPAAGATEAKPAAKTLAAKETKMTATGKVTEISDTMLKIERTVKGKMETMEIALEKACPACLKIKVGDKVKVTYVTKDGKNVAVKVSKVAKGAAKKAKKAEKEGAVKEATPPQEEVK